MSKMQITNMTPADAGFEQHPSTIHAVLVMPDAELRDLIHTCECDANRWGIGPSGGMESPELYERAVKRMRYLQDVQEMVKATRETMAR